MKKVTSHRTHANTGDAIRAISGRSDTMSPHINNLFDIPIDIFELLDHFFNTLSAQLGKKVRSFAQGIKKFADLQLSGKRPRTEKCY